MRDHLIDSRSRSNGRLREYIEHGTGPEWGYSILFSELPPLKGSSLRYDFALKEDDNGDEEADSRKDCC